MKAKETTITWSATSPSAAGTVVSSTLICGLHRYDHVCIDATLIGGTGGTLDVYIQRKLDNDVWQDWAHFPQLAAGTTKRYSASIRGDGGGSTAFVEVGGGSDNVPGVSLAANTIVNTQPTEVMRVVFVAGAGTTAGAVQTIRFTPFSLRT
jgi:hypothetical protein